MPRGPVKARWEAALDTEPTYGRDHTKVMNGRSRPTSYVVRVYARLRRDWARHIELDLTPDEAEALGRELLERAAEARLHNEQAEKYRSGA